MVSSAKRAIYAALVGDCLIVVLKFAAALLTGSSAMLSEGIHSVVDTGNDVLLLYGLRQARRPADERFPFGHGKEVYFWSFVVALLIFAAGAGSSIFKGISHLISPTPVKNLYLNYIVIAIAAVFEGFSWSVGFKEFSKTKGRWGYARAVHRAKDSSILVVLFEDSAAILSLLTAFFGIFLSHITGSYFFDGAGTKTSEIELTQCRVSLRVRPSPKKTCPRCPPQFAQTISVRLPSASGIRFTAPGISSSKLGQPQSDLNLSVDLYNGVLHCLQL